MIPRQWPPVQRLPESPDAVIMTSTGYAINGRHTRTVPTLSAPGTTPNTPRPSFWARIITWRQ